MWRRTGAVVFLSVLSGCSGCREYEVSCSSNRDCVRGEVCNVATSACVACAATEIPYDGIDNDCDPTTLDDDLDADGVGIAFDCDDTDPLAATGLSEVCADGVDNNCDGTIDELTCSDTRPPQVRWVMPAATSTVVGGTYVWSVEAEDNVVVRQMTVRLGGTVLVEETFTTDETKQTLSGTLDTTAYADGDYALVAEAFDVANGMDTATVDVTIDNTTAPTLDVRAPREDATHGGTMTVQVDTTDISGIAEVAVEIDGSVVATLDRSPYEISVDTTSMTEAPHQLVVRSTDRNGASATATVAFSVDNTPPRISIFDPDGKRPVRGVIDVLVYAEDDESGIRRIEAGGASIENELRLQSTFDTSLLPAGPMTFTATAADNAIVDDMPVGNVATESVDITIEFQGPMITLSPLAGGEVMGMTTINAVVTAGAPIGNVAIDVDGTPLVVTPSSPLYAASYDFTMAASETATITVSAVDQIGRTASTSHWVRVVRPPALRVAQQISTGNPLSAAGYVVGDFDGNGVQDVMSEYNVAFGHLANNRWRVLRNEPFPQARPGVHLAADLGNDGVDDLITFEGGALRIYLSQDYTAAGIPNSMASDTLVGNPVFGSFAALGDIDGDMDIDFVSASSNGPISVVDNLGGQFFQRDFSSAGSGVATMLELVDVDGDGDLDVVYDVAGASPAIVVHRNGGNGNFGAPVVTPIPANLGAVAIGEVSRDQYADVVLAAIQGGQEVLVTMRGTATGAFVQGPISNADFGTSTALTVGDIDGDGDDDVVATSLRNSADFFFNDGTGAFALEGSWLVAPDPVEPRLADVDGDGDLDLLGATFGSTAYLENLGGWEFLAAPVTYVNGLGHAAIGDLLAAPGNELAVYVRNTGLITYRVVGSRLVFDRLTPATAGTPAIGANLAIADVDGSGVADVMLPDGRIVLNVGTSSTSIVGWLGTTAVAANDLNNDAAAEAVFCGGQAPFECRVQRVVGSTVQTLDTNPIPQNGAVRLADLNGDTLLDYAAGGTTVQFAFYNGVGWSTGTLAVAGGRDFGLGHVGNDPYADLVATTDSGVRLYTGGPAGPSGTPSSYVVCSDSRRVAVGDLNGDGTADALVTGNDECMGMLFGQTNGAFFPTAVPLRNHAVTTPVLGDLDDDGRMDFVTTADDMVIVFYGNADTL